VSAQAASALTAARPRHLLAAAAVSLAAIAAIVVGAGFESLLPELLRGLEVTVVVTLGAAALAAAVAPAAALARLYAPLPFRWLAVAYIEVFRGTSALVQLFWLFFVLPHFGITLPPLAVGIVALGLNIGAYGAEVVRGAIVAVPAGQWEAARALNLSLVQTLRRIVLPQAFALMIPPWGNLFIELLKGTALVSLITLGDLAFKAQQINQNTLRTAEVFSIVLLVYLVLALLITAGMQWAEHRARRHLQRPGGA
jgi:polar amino acid transport system permease protein